MSAGHFSRRFTLGLMAGAAGSLMTRTGLPAAATGTSLATPADLRALQRTVAGRVIASDDPAFVQTRHSMVWNRRVANVRSPQAIVQAASASDVIAAVRYAGARGLKVAIRSGGHNYHGSVLRDGGLLLDLAALNGFEIDSGQRRATVQPAVKGGAFSAALEPLGLAFPVGHCSDVGLGGYLLNGGFGWNFGEWGAACLGVVGMEMVTAAGELVYADEQHHADLFWAARGAGPGFFAVVTRFDLALQRSRPGIQTFAASFDWQAAPAVAKWLAAIVPRIDATVEMICTLGQLDAQGKTAITISGVAMAATQADAHARLAPLRQLPPGLATIGQVVDQPMTFAEILQLTDTGYPNDQRMDGDQLWSAAPPDVLIASVLQFAASAPPAPSAIAIVFLGGAGPARPMPTFTQAALSVGGGSFVEADAFWSDPAQDAASRAWVRRVMKAAEPYSAGRYVGEADLAAGPNRARECFSPASWARLASLKQAYDPDNLFHSYLTT